MSYVGRPYKGILPTIDASAYVDPTAVLIGDITIGADSSVWPLVAARGDVNTITIGERTSVQDGCVLHVTNKGVNDGKGYPLIIGDDVTIGHKALLHGCIVGNRVLIGMGAIIMDGAEIGDDVIIGGGALVAPGKKLESGALYVGSPARRARALTEEEIEFLKKSAKNYVYLKNTYMDEGKE